ncbi:hypothetical protein [Ramlibacter sp. WS9]|uniref:hypothetical protein n=1 Tax=Ramlibacter sp. WS9 TaxID=1882741 RepID=UPI0011445F43|nr:hypothetical protein [Ramlibacter sp. WS9]ROZ78298.1 hypothetical protein EEB15_07625 [Ramlibacter sp. WS9]
MTYRALAALVLVASAASVLGAADPDPLKSEACKDALAAMEQVIAAPASPARATHVAAAREEAAVACLGRSAGRAMRSGAPEPAVVVRPPSFAGPGVPPAVPAAAAPTPALVIPRPTVITICDPGGCWDSDGRRLNSIGPLLMSPRGPCTVQGGIANCP